MDFNNCYWNYDFEKRIWVSECEKFFDFLTGTPITNGFLYCPYCGSVITIENNNS